jgi:hypothetical protein
MALRTAAARETPWSPLYVASHRFSCSEIVMIVLVLVISLPRRTLFFCYLTFDGFYQDM